MLSHRKWLKSPYALFTSLGDRGLLEWVPDRLYLQLYYRGRTGRHLDLEAPRTFSEKTQWLKLNDRDPRYTLLVDKYRVKAHVAGLLGERAVVPTLGVWRDPSSIDFAKLPRAFVLKANHNSGGVLICRDRDNFDTRGAVKMLKRQLRKSYYGTKREWPYRDVDRLVFAEEYLAHPDDARSGTADEDSGPQGIIDYKIFCFHGEPKFLYLSQGLSNHETGRLLYLSVDWEPIGYHRSDYASFEYVPPRPDKFDEMLTAARLLSDKIPFVRVDFFEHGGECIFSEMTFFPTAGMMPMEPEGVDLEIGQLLDLDRVVVRA